MRKNPRILAHFDLQAVLNTPKGWTLFYLCKFAIYDPTIYNLENQEVSATFGDNKKKWQNL